MNRLEYLVSCQNEFVESALWLHRDLTAYAPLFLLTLDE